MYLQHMALILQLICTKLQNICESNENNKHTHTQSTHVTSHEEKLWLRATPSCHRLSSLCFGSSSLYNILKT